MGIFKIVEIKKDATAWSEARESGTEGIDAILLAPGNSKPPQTTVARPTAGAPTVRPTPQGVVTVENSETINNMHINFLENFNNWTVSPILNAIYKNDIKIPAIHLKEYRLLESTLWNQVKYFAYIAEGVVGRTGEKIEQYIGRENWLSDALKWSQETMDSSFEKAKGVLETLNIDTPDFEGFDNPDPYENLYSTTKTGFEYTFPLYTKDMKNQFAGFSETYSGDGKNLLDKIFNNKLYNINQLAELLSQGGRALVEPGIYIEKTQFYNFGSNLERIDFSFPLLNTISQEQINQNYQFLFLLLYQNTMFRKDRAAFIPPCIYEVLIPGIRYMKFAYISSLKINFLGTRRMIEVDPGIPPGPFKTIVPEAYDVNITISNLHEEGGNYIIRSAANSFDEVKIRDILPLNLRNE